MYRCEATNGCIPAAVIRAEKLRSTTDGFLETQQIGNVLSNHEGISENQKWHLGMELSEYGKNSSKIEGKAIA